MTGDHVAIGDDLWRRVDLGAYWHGLWTAGMEATTGGHVEGTGDLAGEDDLFTLHVGVGGQGSRHQGLGVWVTGRGKERSGGSAFDETPQVHDPDRAAHVAHRC